MPISDVEPNNTAEDGEASSDNIVSNSKRSSLYSTAPRSKVSQAVYIVDLTSQVVIKKLLINPAYNYFRQCSQAGKRFDWKGVRVSERETHADRSQCVLCRMYV